MAVTAVTPEQLVINTRSADLNDSDGVVATVVSDGWAVAVGEYMSTDQLIFHFLADASGDTVTFQSGDYPLATRANLGDLDVVLAASDCRTVVVESGRFERADGTIVITCTDTGTKLTVYAMPKSIGGGTSITG